MSHGEPSRSSAAAARRAGRVGSWHETYVVPAGAHGQFHFTVPPFGRGAATGVIPIGRRGERAAERLAVMRRVVLSRRRAAGPR